MSSSFEERLRALAGRVGIDHGSLESGHARWAIYSQAISIAEERSELLELVRREPDESIASSMVVKIMELVPDSRRIDYVTALPPGRAREYAATRARELSVFEKLCTVSGASDEVEFGTQNWSTWLQLRAANSARNQTVLEVLTATGASKRIRAAAEQRLRSLRASGDP
jgi:hypothetical protein